MRRIWIAAGGGFDQRLSVTLALEHWQAVMRSDATLEDGIAIVEQVMGGDGRRDRGRRCPHVVRRILGGDVLQHDFQRGKSRTIGFKTRSMNTTSRSKISTSGSVTSPWINNGKPTRLHGFQHRMDFADVGYAGIGNSWSRRLDESLQAWMWPRIGRERFRPVALSVRYSVIRGWNSSSLGIASRIRAR